MADINDYPAKSGRLIGEDGTTYNQVDILGGATPVMVSGLDINQYPAETGRIIGEDGNIYNLVDLLQSAGGSSNVYWADILEKPSSFPPASHTHSISEVSNLQSTLNGKLTASQAAAQADSAATDAAGLVADFNTLLANLRAAGIMAT